ncbi:MAG TPA: cyanophycinase [Actinoplanes sp.]|nr:cyanophycinase [Actinoplanes sp.]
MSFGRLMAIGGAAGPDLLARFVALTGGPAAAIVVVAVASAQPDELEARYVSAFAELGAGAVHPLRLDSRAAANEVPALLESATGVFFTGGDQQRIVTTIGGTRTDSVLQRLVISGRVLLGGTSAGAAMMSGTMIVGGDGYAVTTGPGLEFLPGVLIDMHFAERGRLNRLLAAVARYPHELGLGIDEDTAILVEGDRFEVLGSGSVTVVDAGAATDIRAAQTAPPHCAKCGVDAPAGGPIALAGARLHVLPAGCTFELSSRRPSIADAPAGERGRAA